MAEYPTAKTDYILKIDGKYENTLDVEGFAQMMKDPSYCYKFYWLEAIVKLIAQDVAVCQSGSHFQIICRKSICDV